MAPAFWKWPWPAIAAWSLGWAVMTLAARWGAAPEWAVLGGVLPALWLMRRAAPGWRRAVVLGGLPVSVLLVQGTGALPPWTWLVAGAALLLIYPIQAWRDAPLFPTPPSALCGLTAAVALPRGSRVLDAGSGLGDGLMALHAAFPLARLQGVEGGWALSWLSRARLRLAGLRGISVSRGDFWRTDWSAFELVYLFQRPETMPRAWAKAVREMRPGSWLVSLEFEVPGVPAVTRLDAGGGRSVWVYGISPPLDSIPAPAGR